MEFTHAWYQRDDHPPSMDEALNWKKHVNDATNNIDNYIFIHGHVHIPREETVENLTIYCQDQEMKLSILIGNFMARLIGYI